jgi:predicted RNase H-like HicB family nuclease
MKTKADLKNEVKLTPVFEKDKKSDYYKMHYEEFPQAFAEGKTKQEAELNLLQIFIVLLKEREEKIREQSLNNYYSD